MKKLSAIGLISNRDQLMEELMSLGLVEIISQEDKLEDDQWRELVSPDGDENTVIDYDSQLNKINQALGALNRFGSEKKPLLHTRKDIKLKDFQEACDLGSISEEKVARINALMSRHGEIINAINKQDVLRLSLIPWKGYDIPLSETETENAKIVMGVTPAGTDDEEFLKILEQKSYYAVIELVNRDEEQHYYYCIYHKDVSDDVDDVMRKYSFSKMSFSDLDGTVEDNINRAEEELEKLAQEKKEIEAEIGALETGKKGLEICHDQWVMKRDKVAVRASLLVTDHTFSFEGWFPAAAEKKVIKALERNECDFEIREAQADDQPPVLLLNKSFSNAFEAITKLYALPDPNSIDATPYFSLSFAIFFGMMLGDAAYGILLTLITGIILKKFKLEGMKHQMFKLFFYCGIATTFWGAMFGGWFGDIVSVVGKTFFNVNISIPPIWFDPLEDPMKLLIFCFILGGIHLFIGMGLSAWLSIKDGRPLDALFDVGFWYVLLIGAVLALVGIADPIGKWMAIGGALGILLTGGRDKKGLGKITGGLGSLYGITGYLSDVLSYSRLLALGLASSVIASVVNSIGSFGGSGIKGIIVMTLAFVIGHTYNFAINGLGSFVHSCRLQYVEFFGKFYVSGGEAFKPFNEDTKYIAIQREEN